MHSPMPRPRKRGRSKERAKDWLTPKGQLSQALALIQPAPEEREACADSISDALNRVRYEKEAERTFETMELSLDRVVEALRAAETALGRLQREKAALSGVRSAKLLLSVLSSGSELPFPVFNTGRSQRPSYVPRPLSRRHARADRDRQRTLLKRIKKEREFIEDHFSETEDRRGRKKSPAKSAAATWAWGLLDEFGPHKPGQTEGGTWHQLAAVLFGYVTADMLSFDYLRNTHCGTRKLRGRG
jgi:hypothetical protein